MSWQPNTEQLSQLAQYLKDSLSGQNITVQKNAELVRSILSGNSTTTDEIDAQTRQIIS
jgi:hypothetical protein